MFADGLARLLALEGDIEVLGVGGNGRDAVTLVEQLRPRVLLLDFDMPGANGVVAARQVKAARPETMIVMISGSTDDRLILRIGSGRHRDPSCDSTQVILSIAFSPE